MRKRLRRGAPGPGQNSPAGSPLGCGSCWPARAPPSAGGGLSMLHAAYFCESSIRPSGGGAPLRAAARVLLRLARPLRLSSSSGPTPKIWGLLFDSTARDGSGAEYVSLLADFFRTHMRLCRNDVSFSIACMAQHRSSPQCTPPQGGPEGSAHTYADPILRMRDPWRDGWSISHLGTTGFFHAAWRIKPGTTRHTSATPCPRGSQRSRTAFHPARR